MRLVVDTNVVLSGLFWHGAPRRLLELARTGEVTFATSPALLAELVGTLAKPRFTELLAISETSAQRVVDDLQALVEMVYPAPLPNRVCRDPDDDDVLACALAARAELIVSGDGDLLALAAFEGIPIVAPVRAIERIPHRSR